MVSEEIYIIERKIFDVFVLELRSDGIMHLHARGEDAVNLSQYKEIIRTIGLITAGRKVPLLATADEFLVPDEEVRRYMASVESNPYSSASALIMRSLSQKIVANFFTNVLKPIRPIKFFTDKEKAISWLRTFL